MSYPLQVFQEINSSNNLGELTYMITKRLHAVLPTNIDLTSLEDVSRIPSARFALILSECEGARGLSKYFVNYIDKSLFNYREIIEKEIFLGKEEKGFDELDESVTLYTEFMNASKWKHISNAFLSVSNEENNGGMYEIMFSEHPNQKFQKENRRKKISNKDKLMSTRIISHFNRAVRMAINITNNHDTVAKEAINVNQSSLRGFARLLNFLIGVASDINGIGNDGVIDIAASYRNKNDDIRKKNPKLALLLQDMDDSNQKNDNNIKKVESSESNQSKNNNEEEEVQENQE